MAPGFGRRWGPRASGAVAPIGAPGDNGPARRVWLRETPPAERQRREFPTAGPDGAAYPSLCLRRVRLTRLRGELWVLVCQLQGLRFVRSIGSGCLESVESEDSGSGEKRRPY